MFSFLRPRPGHPYLAGAPLMMAHRGGGALAPENTLFAFRRAVDRWEADVLEMDVRASADGVLVVIHDATVDRTTDGSGPVAAKAWDELRELDAGHGFVDPAGHRSGRGKGIRIPRFEEVLEAFPEVRLNVDSKVPEAAPLLLELVRRHGAQHRVLIAAEREAHRSVARGYPGPWGATRSQIRRFWLLQMVGLGRFFFSRADVLQVPEVWEGRRVVSPGFVDVAHRRNLPVHVWTVDDEETMRKLLRWGVDGIQSDRLDRLARVLCAEASRPAPPGLREEGEAGRVEGDEETSFREG